jgi:hypothetical protein
MYLANDEELEKNLSRFTTLSVFAVTICASFASAEIGYVDLFY